MKVLVVTNKVRTYALGFKNMFIPLQELGHEIIWAADFSGYVGNDRGDIPCITEQICIRTSPFDPSNRKAYGQLLDIIDKYGIEAVVCSTPIGGALGRLAAKKKGISPVVYEAHGFLFFKGAPFINRTVYKWEEVLLAKYTDALITITKEDRDAAKQFVLRSGKEPYLVHGAGVNTGVIVHSDRDEKRRELGIPEDAFLIVSAGELNKNKNTQVIVRAVKEMNDENVFYAACGDGEEKANLEALIKEFGLEKQVKLLGYRTDMPEIMASADAFTIMSHREGLPRALMEAMDLGLPCVCSNTRGMRDLIDPDGGYLCGADDGKAFARAFAALKAEPEKRVIMGEHNREKVKGYSAEVVRKELFDIYREVLGDAR